MATLDPVPELADRGYWYVVAEETVADETAFGGTVTRPSGIPAWHSGWTATYIGDGTVVVRSPDLIVGVVGVNESAAAKLIAAGEATRPYGRIRGR